MLHSFSLFYKFLSEGHVRSIKAKKNILASFLVQGIGVVVTFLMVRLTLDYLDQTKYGIWITVSSLLAWFSFFDIGLGNGLRNKLAIALANKDYDLGKTYLSTTYFILIIVITLVSLVFFVANRFINWSVVLNTDSALVSELSLLATIVFGLFFLRFVVQIISVVLNADQRPTIANLIGLAANSISLIVVYILTKTTPGSLIYLGLTLSLSPLLVMIFASAFLYRNDYKLIAPSLTCIDLMHAKELLSLGSKFFFIQIAGLIIYGSSNLIIGHFFGPAEVTPYNIAYKYFSLLYMAFSIIMVPFWSAFTEAWTKKDILWIRSIMSKLLWVWSLICLTGIVMLLFSNWFFYVWIGKQVTIPFSLSLGLFTYFIAASFGSIFTAFVNGVGKVKLQMYSSYFVAILFVCSVSFMIIVLNIGVTSIVIGLVLSTLYSVIVTPMQYYKLIHGKATGVWNE